MSRSTRIKPWLQTTFRIAKFDVIRIADMNDSGTREGMPQQRRTMCEKQHILTKSNPWPVEHPLVHSSAAVVEPAATAKLCNRSKN